MKRMKILAVVDYYLPGYKGGGPIVSVSRMVQQLHDQFDFVVFTRDRDLGEMNPYEGIEPGTLNSRKDCQVFYAKPDQLNLRTLRKLVADVKPDIIYLNSYFSKLTRIALAMRKLGMARGIRYIVAPRGEFSPGALKLKSLKKSAYLRFASLAGLHESVLWHVSSPLEKKEAIDALDNRADVYVLAPDLMQNTSEISAEIAKPEKTAGHARFVWISRISPKKNLLGAIESLMACEGTAELTVYGPVEDEAYWQQCLELAKKLPTSVRFEHKGGIPASEVVKELCQHHFFLFPTLGENFGHVIPEALAAGCPVLVSDQTPWEDLAGHEAGWVMPLDARESWRQAVQQCIDMEAQEYSYRSRQCLAFLKFRTQGHDAEKSSGLFHKAIAC